MKREFCIFNSNKTCDDCGECLKCDLNKNKICNNCGKCLELEGYDMKAIKIDEIAEDSEEISELDIQNDTSANSEEYLGDDLQDIKDEDVKIEYIEDIEGLSEVLEDDSLFDRIATEQFPGLIRLRKNEK